MKSSNASFYIEDTHLTSHLNDLLSQWVIVRQYLFVFLDAMTRTQQAKGVVYTYILDNRERQV